MSGFSEKTLDTAAQFADYNLCMIDTYKEHTERFTKNKKRMVSAQIIIRDTYEEAERFADINVPEEHKRRWTIFGTESDIVKEFEYLESIGVTDIMLRTNNKDDKVNLVHNFVKRYNSGEMV
jgi:alkanesulfonate monooxygenase SsuD/methylene tetrahydromethanopterin reductase-like flavin-dependent oxidoreductase (luciferase family)